MDSSIILKRYIWGYRPRTLFLISVITLSVVFFCSIGIIITSIMANEAKIRDDKYGLFDYFVIGVTPKGEEMANTHAYIDHKGWIWTIGHVPSNNGAYIGYMDSEAVNMARIKAIAGRLPEKDGEIALEISCMQKLGIKVNVGDKLPLNIVELSPKQNSTARSLKEEFTVTGILDEFVCVRGYEQQIGTGDIGTFPGIIVPIATVKRYNEGQFICQKSLLYSVKKGVSEKEVRDRIQIEGKYGYLSIGNNKFLEMINWKLGDRNNIMTCMVSMGLVAVFMVFVITNSFFISVSERQKHLGILRAVGATSRQIRNMVLGEAMLIAAISIPPGILISVAVSRLALVAIENFTKRTQVFIVSPYILVSAVAVSLVSVAAAALVPAVRASRLMPIKAMSPNDAVIKNRDVLYKIKLNTVESKSISFMKEKRILVKMAIANIERNKSRAFMITMIIAMSMAVFMLVFTIISIFYKNIESNRLTGGYTYDIRLRQTAVNTKTPEGGLTEGQVQTIREMEGVAQVSAYKILRFSLCGIPKEKLTPQIMHSRLLEYEYSPDAMDLFQKTAGSNIQLLNIGIMGITSDKMRQLSGKTGEGGFLLYAPGLIGTGLNMGDEIIVTAFKAGGDVIVEKHTIKISGIINKLPEGIAVEAGNGNGAAIFTDEKTYESLSKAHLFNDIYVYASKDANMPVLERGLRMLAGETSILTVDALWETMQKYKDDYKKDQLAGYSFCFVIAILAISMYMNSMHAAVLARKTEFAMMRAVGMTKNQLSWIIGIETAIYSIISSLFAILVCLLLLPYLVGSEGYNFMGDVHWGVFILVFAVNLIIGQLAAIWPLRKVFSNQIINLMKSIEI